MIPEVRRQIWNGKVPLKITVNEPISFGPQEYLIAASRISYLWLYLPQVLAYFTKYMDPDITDNENSWWLEYGGVPVPFNKPIGLLHDIMVGSPSYEPWKLTLTKGDFPSTTILQLNNTDSTLYTYWLNQFKESCYVRDGNSRAVMALSVHDQESLWKSIEATTDPQVDTSDSFWQLASGIFKRYTAAMEKVPIKFYVKSRSLQLTKTIQRSASGSHTLENILHSEEIGITTSFDIILHGIRISETVNVSQLYLLCTYPDGFLHIVLIPNESA